MTREEAQRLRDSGNSLLDIANILKSEYPKKTEKQRWEIAHSLLREKVKNTAVGVIGDTHIPFVHKNYLQFLKDTFKKHHVETVVHIGDLADNHAVSRHLTETCAKSPYDELDLAINMIKEYTKAFPKVKMCIGNHDTIIERQSATLGIGKRFLKSYSDIFELPKTWELAEEHIIDNVLYKHGINCGGPNGMLNAALQERMSVVLGHYHSGGGVRYSTNPRDIIFGLQVGCGIQISQYAFAYSTHAKYRPTLGCGIVYSSSHAEFVPMGDSYFSD